MNKSDLVISRVDCCDRGVRRDDVAIRPQTADLLVDMGPDILDVNVNVGGVPTRVSRDSDGVKFYPNDVTLPVVNEESRRDKVVDHLVDELFQRIKDSILDKEAHGDIARHLVTSGSSNTTVSVEDLKEMGIIIRSKESQNETLVGWIRRYVAMGLKVWLEEIPRSPFLDRNIDVNPVINSDGIEFNLSMGPWKG